MRKIILIQHTESQHHVNRMVGSWVDWPLTEKGKADAKNIVENLAREYDISSMEMFSSDLQRCTWIADLITDTWQIPKTILKEIRGKNYGAACGNSDAWLKENMLPLTDGDPRNIYYRYTSSAENTVDLWKRIYPFFRRYFEDSSQDLILVGHGDVINVLYAMWLNLQVTDLEKVDIFTQPASVGVLVELDTGKRIITKAGDLSYKMKR